MIGRLLFTFVLFALFYPLCGQNIQFSQYYTSSLFLNPSLAGISPDLQVSLNHKRQLNPQGIEKEISQVSILYPFVSQGFNSRQFGGIGVTAFNHSIDKGNYQENGLMVAGAYNLRLGLFSPDYVIFGLQGGYFNRSFNLNNSQWGSQYTPYLGNGFDPNAPNPSQQYNQMARYPVFNAGLTYYYNPSRTYRLYKFSAFSGLAVKHLNAPNKSFIDNEVEREAMLFAYNGGFEFNVSYKLQWSPHAIFYYVNNVSSFNVGNYVAYTLSENRSFNANNLYLTLGVWYRFRESFIFTSGFQNKNLQFAFSYDLNGAFIFTEENEVAVPSFEISLIYTARRDSKGGRSSNPLF